jgi:ribosome biogenesis GTPase A
MTHPDFVDDLQEDRNCLASCSARDRRVSFGGRMKGVALSIEERLESILRSASFLLSSLKFEENERKVRDLAEGIKDNFIIVVLGEFSSGKSTFINALLQEDILATSILPETVAITVVGYGDVKKAAIIYKNRRKYALRDESQIGLIKRDAKEIDRVKVSYPLPRLKGFFLVDTPGLNTIFRDHETRTKDFLHRADTIIWILDATKAGKSGEKEYLEYAREHAGKMIGVVNKIDLVDEKELQVLREFLEGHFQGFFGKIFYISSIKANGVKEKMEEERNHDGNGGLRGLEDFLFGEIVPAKEILKYKATLGSLYQIMGEAHTALEKGEGDLIDKQSMLEEVTEGLRRIEGYVSSRLDGMISDRLRSFAQNRKKPCASFLKQEINIGKALYHMRKPLDITEGFGRYVLSEKVLKDLLNEIARTMEVILIDGWKGRIEEGDIRNYPQVSVSFPPLGPELDGIVSRVYSQVIEKVFPFILTGIVTTLIWLLCTLSAAALIPMSLLMFGLMLGERCFVRRRKEVVKEFSGFIDQYCEVIRERVKEVAASVNKGLCLKAQDNVISEILGYKLSYGQVETRLVSIRKARKEIENLLGEARRLEKEISG